MVHCISSSEPDSVDLVSQSTHLDEGKLELVPNSQNYGSKGRNTANIEYAESSTILSDSDISAGSIKAQDTQVTSRGLEKGSHTYSPKGSLVAGNNFFNVQ